jgi:RNA polymerase sigma factor for flagellar operon FliA
VRDAEAPRALWDALATPEGSQDALQDLARHYQDLVRSIAFNLKLTLPSYINDQDLLSYGQFGLLRAIERYDPEKGPFRRFASVYVRGAIVDELRSQDWAPKGLRREQRKMRQATKRLSDADGDPTLSQIAASLGWEAAKVVALQRGLLRGRREPGEPGQRRAHVRAVRRDF